MPGKNPDGRGGHHRFEGSLFASGKDIEQNCSFEKKHIENLASTIFHLLSADIPQVFEGTVIIEIFEE